jgi:3-deoxy-D-manno-octulosonic-acid transferase
MPVFAVRLFYNLALFLLLPIFIPYVLWRLVMGKETAESLLAKLGLHGKEKPPKGGIWIHAVSVGEVNTALPLAELLISRGRTVIFSVSTQTGMSVAKSRLGGRAFVTWFPFDFPFAVDSAVARFSPSVVVLLETEIWPNFIMGSASAGVKCVVANGRISDGSFGNYKKFRWLLAPVLGKVSLFLMQTEQDAERISSLGADKNRVRVIGNIKFDRPLPTPEGKETAMERFKLPPRARVVVFASTHPREEDAFLDTMENLSRRGGGLFVVIAPRHVERTSDVISICEEHHLIPNTRSSGQKCENGSVLVLDTIGELARLYEAADIAVMGGSFIRHGGQNPLEASVWGKPVVFGPHMENFRDISQKLLEGGGAKRAENQDALEEILYEWLRNPEQAKEAGEKGRQIVMNNRGALEKTVKYLDELLERI